MADSIEIKEKGGFPFSLISIRDERNRCMVLKSPLSGFLRGDAQRVEPSPLRALTKIKKGAFPFFRLLEAMSEAVAWFNVIEEKRTL